jgi:hypothetical protein
MNSTERRRQEILETPEKTKVREKNSASLSPRSVHSESAEDTWDAPTAASSRSERTAKTSRSTQIVVMSALHAIASERAAAIKQSEPSKPIDDAQAQGRTTKTPSQRPEIIRSQQPEAIKTISQQPEMIHSKAPPRLSFSLNPSTTERSSGVSVRPRPETGMVTQEVAELSERSQVIRTVTPSILSSEPVLSENPPHPDAFWDRHLQEVSRIVGGMLLIAAALFSAHDVMQALVCAIIGVMFLALSRAKVACEERMLGAAVVPIPVLLSLSLSVSHSSTSVGLIAFSAVLVGLAASQISARVQDRKLIKIVVLSSVMFAGAWMTILRINPYAGHTSTILDWIGYAIASSAIGASLTLVAATSMSARKTVTDRLSPDNPGAHISLRSRISLRQQLKRLQKDKLR